MQQGAATVEERFGAGYPQPMVKLDIGKHRNQILAHGSGEASGCFRLPAHFGSALPGCECCSGDSESDFHLLKSWRDSNDSNLRRHVYGIEGRIEHFDALVLVQPKGGCTEVLGSVLGQ